MKICKIGQPWHHKCLHGFLGISGSCKLCGLQMALGGSKEAEYAHLDQESVLLRWQQFRANGEEERRMSILEAA